ncbi:DNA polymerase [Nostoc linckia z18]|uniref:DNA polymerase n=2 Tax=Nostoc linckia TaxID=92942 RepID=A0A9Q5ZA11_NOSLI|nr:reverse transcriptase domain-containing protein [Nostoc linckia]PHK27369.1 DNA polymerase [Nostoc linckia z15]PHK44254.1 DNA polymerase [Nostoc linckia z16]PHJ57221.1 DNA polymerase [Nostoc linckia z1]PHJ59491.1 DNA polymerase [Nostoc linckia z3]PHJ64080.1 DNA polymerase [Nostoc linckia z2]
MVRHIENYSESWKSLPWKKFRRNLFRLQKRVFKAVREGNKRKAISLQKLILKSNAARLLAIRQVSQLNAGKKTAGIDGKKSLNSKERFQLEKLLKASGNDWEHQKLRNISIPKKDGSTRMLKIPTIADRCWQCLAKYALEPAHEALFHERSYGFRPGRSAHDAQKILFSNLNSSTNGINKRVIELDIEKCFEKISHTTIMNNLIAPKGIKQGIFRCLKAGINPDFPEQGTCQGGVVSPLLANIALNGIEDIHQSIRYADDMVIILKPKDDAIKILEKISQFLEVRGLNVSQKKTRITATTDGFDFLGWHFKVQSNGKFRSIPSADNFKKFRQKVKAIVNNSNYGSKVKTLKLAPIVRGWRNYHKFCKMDGSRFSLWHTRNRAWKVFKKESKITKESTDKLIEKAFPKVPYSENSHINVKGNKSPFDGDLTYWSERNSKLYDGETSKALKKQKHTCGHCGLKCISEERVHLHHIDGNHNNWKPKNLIAVHESCHDYTHIGKRIIF